MLIDIEGVCKVEVTVKYKYCYTSYRKYQEFQHGKHFGNISIVEVKVWLTRNFDQWIVFLRNKLMKPFIAMQTARKQVKSGSFFFLYFHALLS